MTSGVVLHFPAGSYYEQTENEWRALELGLMRTTWKAARIAYDTTHNPDRVTPDDMDFVSWAMSQEDDINGNVN